MQVTFKTSKAEGLLILPDKGFCPEMAFVTELDGKLYLTEYANDVIVWEIELPEGNWKLIGSPFEVTEEQARELVGEPQGFSVIGNFYTKHEDLYSPLKAALLDWNSLLKSLEVYKENPHGKEKPDFDRFSFEAIGREGEMTMATYHMMYEKWEHTQSRTGVWVLLIKEKG